jgi:hypothetical protein
MANPTVRSVLRVYVSQTWERGPNTVVGMQVGYMTRAVLDAVCIMPPAFDTVLRHK